MIHGGLTYIFGLTKKKTVQDKDSFKN
jgi:hypothetical protein